MGPCLLASSTPQLCVTVAPACIPHFGQRRHRFHFSRSLCTASFSFVTWRARRNWLQCDRPKLSTSSSSSSSLDGDLDDRFSSATVKQTLKMAVTATQSSHAADQRTLITQHAIQGERARVFRVTFLILQLRSWPRRVPILVEVRADRR